jgi:hypothetical protein
MTACSKQSGTGDKGILLSVSHVLLKEEGKKTG